MFKRTIVFCFSILLSSFAFNAYSTEEDSSAQDNTAQDNTAQGKTAQETNTSAPSELHASNEEVSSSSHRIPFMSGLGVIYDEQNLIDPTISDYRLAFQHDINEDWGLELGYVAGDSENFDFLFESLLFNQKTKFNALQLGAYRQLIDNESYRFYARVSANFYDYEFVSDTDTTHFSGTSYGLGLGFQFKLSETFILLSEYNYDDYSRLDTSTFNIGFAIAF